MFAMTRKPRGMFGAPQTYGTPPIFDPGQSQGEPEPVPGLGMDAQPRKGGGFFGQNGVGRAIAGYLGDALLQQADMQPLYAPSMQYRQKLAEQQRQASMKREQDWQDYVRKQEYEAAHPKPVNNDTINDFEWYKGLSAEDRALYEQMRPVYRQGPDGQFYRVQTNQSALPTAPVGKLTPIAPGGPQVAPAGTFRP